MYIHLCTYHLLISTYILNGDILLKILGYRVYPTILGCIFYILQYLYALPILIYSYAVYTWPCVFTDKIQVPITYKYVNHTNILNKYLIPGYLDTCRAYLDT